MATGYTSGMLTAITGSGFSGLAAQLEAQTGITCRADQARDAYIFAFKGRSVAMPASALMQSSPADISGMLKNIYKELMGGMGGALAGGNLAALGQLQQAQQNAFANQMSQQQLQGLMGMQQYQQQQYATTAGAYESALRLAWPTRPETHVAWLDRRVNEMRVRL